MARPLVWVKFGTRSFGSGNLSCRASHAGMVLMSVAVSTRNVTGLSVVLVAEE